MTKNIVWTAAAAALWIAGCGGETTPATCDDPCLTPPAATCNGGTLIAFNALGECVEGVCIYTPAQTDCTTDGGTCEAGACVSPVDPCEDVTCDAIPEDACEGDVLVTYADAGTCSEGECDYGRTENDCAAAGQVCSGLRCLDPADPCVGVVCEDEPDDTCEGDIAVRYNDAGVCEEGGCTYSESARVDCAAEGGTCSRGRCSAGDPCEGITCNAPPASTCDDETVVLSYEAPGTCVDGECRYGQTLNDCADSDEVCVDGECVAPDACIGVVCNVPPAARCDGASAVSYATAGTCADGLCSYAETTVDCAATGGRCVRGACVATNPCDGVVCNTPPAAICDGTVGVSYRPTGTCDAGSCDYPEDRFDCATIGQICDDGECVSADPLCEGVVCAAPPGDTCDSDERYLTVYTGVSSCSEGVCSYESNVIDCLATGRACLVDSCVAVDTCAGVTCNQPNRCEGNTAVQYAGPGTCDGGTCDYSRVETRVDCGTRGLPCYEGECRRQVEILTLGDFMITELMPAAASGDPLDAWFELENRLPIAVNLRGLTVYGNAARDEYFTVDSDLVVPAGGFVIFTGRAPGPVDGVPTYVWPDYFTLGEAGDTLAIDTETEGTISQVEFDAFTWDYDMGVSVQLDASTDDLLAPYDAANWCASTRVDGLGDLSSAGRRGEACVARVDAGDFVITELMLDGQGSRPEDAYQWIEIYNASGGNASLAGVTLTVDGGEWFTFPIGARLSDNGYWAASSRALPGTAFDGTYSYVTVPTTGGTLRLEMAGVVIDSVNLPDPFAGGANHAVGVSGVPSATTNDLVASWCAQTGDASGPWGAGTPGLANLCAE